MSESGTVYLVGAGPGDAGLLTLRGAELLARADVVVYDALVNPELLALAPAAARRIHGGKRAGDHSLPQDELNALLVREAKAGHTVVRLKGGDPYIFGRGGEEALALASAKVPFEVVPGVSSAIAVPAYAGIPLTHRDFCSAFQVVTGHEDPDKPNAAVDWAQLARFPGTKVVLMGMEHLRAITGRLIANGLDGTTPAAVVRWGTLGRQETLVATVATLADAVEARGLKSPAVIVIGGVVTLRDRLDWCGRRPLFGQRIVVTRTRDQAGRLSSRLRDDGADVLEIPTIRIVPPEGIHPLIDAIVGIGEYDWAVFTSPNGVDAFFDAFFKAYPDIRSIGNLRIAAVGPATAERVKERHLAVDVMPEKYLASQVAKAIHAYENVENLRMLLLRAEVANPDLPAQLVELGAIVDDVAAYRTVPETEDQSGAAARFAEEGADWITFTSSSTVENFHARFPLPQLLAGNPKMKTASIGPETTKALVALGIQPTVEARQHTIEGLVKAIEKA
ncbi:MAG: uroporphyrinogen-III C-methyltransferase [Verrucomicrobia bacterium]|nr:MAG: uroporphyrinogen-III C-methyltransferase [Verrucomicrobiota bacterium]